MSIPLEVVELELIPIPPDTVASVKQELIPLIEAALHEAGKDELFANTHIQIQVEKTFPTDMAIMVGLTFLSGIALETYKEIILPALKKRFEVKQQPKVHRHKPKADMNKSTTKKKTSKGKK
jgi:hypothetical protein